MQLPDVLPEQLSDITLVKLMDVVCDSLEREPQSPEQRHLLVLAQNLKVGIAKYSK